MRCITSGRFTPAAAIFTRISPVPGSGTGRGSGASMSGPPAALMPIAVIWDGIAAIVSSLSTYRDDLVSRGLRNVTAAAVAARFLRQEVQMPAIDDDDKPKKKIAHQIGQDLTLLSLEELAARVQLLRDEIQRIEADMTQKNASRTAADQFFKR